MPRNGSGSYTIPNAFTPSTKVRSSEVNANFADVATALSQSLATDGQTGMAGPLKAAAGTQAAPGMTWASELGSGWYRAGANDFRYAVAGADVLKVTASGLTVYGALTATVTVADASVTNAKMANMPASTIKANLTGAAAVPTDKTLTEVLDALAGATEGSLIYRGASAWSVRALATTAEILANTADKILETDRVWASAETVTLTDGATITLNLATMINGKVTLAGNRTLARTNAKVGQSGLVEVIQDATGSRTLAYTAGEFVFAGATAPVLTTTASARDLLFYQVLNDGKVFVSLVKGAA